jgi:hypothetical protein
MLYRELPDYSRRGLINLAQAAWGSRIPRLLACYDGSRYSGISAIAIGPGASQEYPFPQETEIIGIIEI